MAAEREIVMKRHERNKLLMIDAVVSYLSANQAVTANAPVIAERMSKLDSIGDSIRSYEEMQSHIARASSAKKSEARKKAEFAGAAFAGKLYSLGVNTGNTDLKEKYFLTVSDLRNTADVLLVNKLNAVREDVSNNLSSLGSYGIAQADFDKYSEIADAYEESVGKKETSYAQRSAAVKSIGELFDEAAATLKALDRDIEEYRIKEPNFFNGYKSARGIRDLGYRSKALPEAIQNQKEQ